MKTDTNVTENYRSRTRYQGVYERVSETRTFKGKPDICYDIAYRQGRKLIWEKVGWLSEGYSAKLAADVRAERVRSIRHKEELPRQKKGAPLFEVQAEKYIQWAKENNKDHRNHRSRYDNHIAPRFEKKRMDEISTWNLEKLKSALLKEGSSPATAKHVLVLIRQIYNTAILWGDYKGPNPVKGVELPTLKNRRERFLSYEEADLLLRALEKRSPLVHDMALLSLHSGMRAGEIFGLRRHDIDLQNDLITILDPKNEEPRKAHMTKAVREMLSGRILDLEPNQFVFPGRGDEGSPSMEVSDTFHRVADELFNKGIRDRRHRVTFHTLRHTFASWLALQGESSFTIAELLGHKTLAMARHYTHLDRKKQMATAALEKAFTEGKAAKQEAAQ